MMLTFRAGKVTLLVALASLAAACSREQQDWRSAEAADTAEGYGQFLEHHPESELATQARARVAQLSEDKEWQRAGSADTADAYRQFLAQHPSGKWAQEARIRIENFSLGGPQAASAPAIASTSTRAGSASPAPGSSAMTPAPTATSAANTTSTRALPGEAATAPAPAATTHVASSTPPTRPVSLPATAAAPPPTRLAAAMPSAASATTSGYGVQLGAFSSEGAATNEWQQLTSRFSADLHGLSPHVVSANTPTGHLFRLQAQVVDEAHARALCDALKKHQQPCVAVLPH